MNIKTYSIYNVNLPKSQSSLQQGYRPCVIVSNHACNTYSDVVTVVPLTTKFKDLPTHCDVNCQGVTSQALCEQIQTVPKQTVGKFLSDINEQEIEAIKHCICIQCGILSSYVIKQIEWRQREQQMQEDRKFMELKMPEVRELLNMAQQIVERWVPPVKVPKTKVTRAKPTKTGVTQGCVTGAVRNYVMRTAEEKKDFVRTWEMARTRQDYENIAKKFKFNEVRQAKTFYNKYKELL